MSGIGMKRLLDKRARQESAIDYGQVTENLVDGDLNVSLLQTGKIVRASRANAGEHYAVGEVVTLADPSASGIAVGGGKVVIGRPNGSMRNTTTPAAETAKGAGMVITQISPSPLVLCYGTSGSITIRGFNLVEPTYPAPLTQQSAPTVTSTQITINVTAPSTGAALFALTFPVAGVQPDIIIADAIEVRACVGLYAAHLIIGPNTLAKTFESDSSLAAFTEQSITGTPTVIMGRAWAGAGDDVYVHNGNGGRGLFKVNRDTGAATELLVDSGYTPHSLQRDCYAWDATGGRVGIIGTKASDSTIRAVVLTISTGAVLWESASLLAAGAGRFSFFDGTDFWFACTDNKIRRVNGSTYVETVITTSSRPAAMTTDGTSIFVGYDKLSGTDPRLLGKISRATNVIDAAEVAAADSKRNAMAVAYSGGDLYLLCIDSLSTNFGRVIKVNPTTMAILNETLLSHTAAAVTSNTSQIALNTSYVFIASTNGSGVISRMDRANLGNLATGTIPSGLAGYNAIGNALIWI